MRSYMSRAMQPFASFFGEQALQATRSFEPASRADASAAAAEIAAPPGATFIGEIADVLIDLPLAHEKFLGLRDELADLREPMWRKSEEINNLLTERVRSKQWLDRLNAERATEAQIEAAKDKVDNLSARLKREQDGYSARQAALQPLARLVQRIEEYLEKQARVAPFTGPVAAKPAKGDDHFTAVKRVRERIKAIDADIAVVKASPLPSAEAKMRAREQIAQLAEDARPKVYRLLEARRAHEQQIIWPFEHVNPQYRDGLMMYLGISAWLHKDALIAAVDREIDEVADDQVALSNRDYDDKLRTMCADKLALEREEEALICDAADSGIKIPRRDGFELDVRAVLGLADTMPESRKEWE